LNTLSRMSPEKDWETELTKGENREKQKDQTVRKTRGVSRRTQEPKEWRLNLRDGQSGTERVYKEGILKSLARPLRRDKKVGLNLSQAGGDGRAFELSVQHACAICSQLDWKQVADIRGAGYNEQG